MHIDYKVTLPDQVYVIVAQYKLISSVIGDMRVREKDFSGDFVTNSRPTIIFIIFWDFLMFYQIFLSPQVKRCSIITDKHGIYEFLHDLTNDLKLTILGK